MKVLRKRSRVCTSILAIGMLWVLYAGVPLVQAAQPSQEGLQSRIHKIETDIVQLKKQIAQLQAEVQAFKGQPTVEPAPPKTGQVPLDKVFRAIPGWKVTLSSYERLESGGVKFHFVIENLQDKPAEFVFHSKEYVRSGMGQKAVNPIYILDDKTNKYENPTISPKDNVTLIPGMPVEGSISFTQSELVEARAIVFYFKFRGWAADKKRSNVTDVLYAGPIKLR